MITTRLSPGFKGTLHGYDTRQQPGYRIVNERYIETGQTEAVNVACYEIDLTARPAPPRAAMSPTRITAPTS